jgi:hypothetical protein
LKLANLLAGSIQEYSHSGALGMLLPDLQPRSAWRVDPSSCRGYDMFNKVTKYLYSPKADRFAPRYRSNTPSLPANIQDHLGRLLRAEYYEHGDKPRFLGDPALPLEFDPYLQRLDQRERELRASMIGEKGRHAVAAALLGMHA